MKTACRTRTRTGKKKKKDESHLCGEDKGHEKDCKGEICITGYMKEKDYVEKESDIKNTRYKDVFKDNVYIAIQNAVELRRTIGCKETHALSLLDPYTDFDRLVFKLLNIEYDYQWVSYEKIKNRDISFDLTLVDSIVYLKIENNSKIAYVFNPYNFALLDVQSNAIIFPGNSHTLLPTEQITVPLNLNDHHDFVPSFFRFPWKNVEIGILEL